MSDLHGSCSGFALFNFNCSINSGDNNAYPYFFKTIVYPLNILKIPFGINLITPC